jgi:hypothetical protein
MWFLYLPDANSSASGQALAATAADKETHTQTKKKHHTANKLLTRRNQQRIRPSICCDGGRDSGPLSTG